MFDFKRPCKNCPFLKSNGRNFGLGKERVEEIVNAVSFQCHKTVDYDQDENGHAGNKPQQCAGLIAMLHNGKHKPNVITRAAIALTGFDPASIDGSGVYNSVKEAIEDHEHQ
jgi:hypothetical protein